METKICTKCKRELPATKECFCASNKTKSGIRSSCKQCDKKYREENRERSIEYCKNWYDENKEYAAERSKKYREANKEKISKRREENKEAKVAYMKQYYVKNKEKVLQWQRDNRERSYGTSRRWKGRNKKQQNDYQRQYVNENRDKVYVYAQKRRARQNELPATLTCEQWKLIKDAFNNQCAYCGEEKILVQEHFVPLSSGGWYTHNNILPSCKGCNSSKRDKDFFEWYPKQKIYNKKREQKILKHLNIKDGFQQTTITL